jgi:hypothetical protein
MLVARAVFSLAVVLLIAAAATACGKAGSTRIAAGDVPSSAELDQYVTGAGGIRLAMSEEEVTDALGTKPARRREALSQDGITEVAWDNIDGPHPGHAAGGFVAGKLIWITFATASTSLPRVGRDAASSLLTGAVAQRSVARTLRLEDVEAVTGSRGLRARWTFTHRPPDRADIASVWVWEVEPGGRMLSVEERDGLAGQPVEREWRK